MTVLLRLDAIEVLHIRFYDYTTSCVSRMTVLLRLDAIEVLHIRLDSMIILLVVRPE